MKIPIARKMAFPLKICMLLSIENWYLIQFEDKGPLYSAPLPKDASHITRWYRYTFSGRWLCRCWMACEWQFIGWQSMFKKDWEELIQTLCYLKTSSVLLWKILRSKVLKDFSNFMLHEIQITVCNASRLTVGLWSDRYYFQLLWMWLLLFIFFIS